MRQVGKTTLLRKFSKTYFTFDEPGFDLKLERLGPSLLQQTPPPVALDEIQKCPPAFDAVKFIVDQSKKMGRFLLSGSVRFASRKQIRESLTGRIILFEIYPLSLAECHGKKPNPFLSLLKKSDSKKIITTLTNHAWAKKSDILHYMKTGGLPGICFRRDEKVRKDLFEVHLDSLLGRDIHLLHQTGLSVPTLRNMLVHLGRNQGETCSVVSLARNTGISRITANRVLQAMEGLFLIRPFGKSYFIEDLGLSYYLNPHPDSFTLSDKLKVLYHELRFQFYSELRQEAEMQPYSTRGGLEVPFFIKYKTGERVAILANNEKGPTNKNLKTVTWLKKKYPKLKAVLLYEGEKAFSYNNDLLLIPWNWVF